MAKQYQRTVFGRSEQLWRGMNRGSSPLASSPGFVYDCENVDFNVSSLSSRPGSVKIESYSSEVYEVDEHNGVLILAEGQRVWWEDVL